MSKKKHLKRDVESQGRCIACLTKSMTVVTDILESHWRQLKSLNQRFRLMIDSISDLERRAATKDIYIRPYPDGSPKWEELEWLDTNNFYAMILSGIALAISLVTAFTVVAG